MERVQYLASNFEFQEPIAMNERRVPACCTQAAAPAIEKVKRSTKFAGSSVFKL